MTASSATQSKPDPANPEKGRRGLLQEIGVNAVLPYATYFALTGQGVPTVTALLAGTVFPVGAALLSIYQERRVAALGVIVLAATAASVAGALWFTNPVLLLAKGSLVTGVVSLVFLASLAARRPLIYYLASTGKGPEARHQAEALWQSQPVYRSVMRRLTLTWALAMLAEASMRLLLIPLLPIAVFLPISEMMWIGFSPS